MAGSEWDRLAKLVADRMAAENMKQVDVIASSGLSQPTVASFIAGEPRAARPRETTLRQLDDGLGWRRGSVAAILDGGDPVAETPRTGEISSPDADRRVAQLELDLAALREDLVGAIDHWTAQERVLVAAVERLSQLVGDP